MIRVSRLSLRCVAPHAERARALEVRTRLERVAAGPLRAALDAALGDVDGDVRIGTVRVPLDLDPSEYDDETFAWLWASRIAAAVEPHLPSVPWTERLLALPRRDLASVAALLLARGLPEVAAERGAVLAALRAAAGTAASAPPAGAPSRPADQPGRRRPSPDAAAAAPVVTPAAVPGAPAAAPERGTPSPAAPPHSPRAAAAPPVPAAALAPPRAEDEWTAAWRAAAATAPAAPSQAARAVADSVRRVRLAPAAHASAAGGLVLLYPWLASFPPEPYLAASDLPEPDVRRAAYAALLGDPALQHDPLVRLLAGVEPDAPTAHVEVDAEVDADPEPVLRAFAGMLRGFEASSAAYLREHLLVRPARVEPLDGTVLVRLASRPLDLLLRGLPYPLGVVRLPWTPPIAVELRC